MASNSGGYHKKSGEDAEILDCVNGVTAQWRQHLNLPEASRVKMGQTTVTRPPSVVEAIMRRAYDQFNPGDAKTGWKYIWRHMSHLALPNTKEAQVARAQVRRGVRTYYRAADYGPFSRVAPWPMKKHKECMKVELDSGGEKSSEDPKLAAHEFYNLMTICSLNADEEYPMRAARYTVVGVDRLRAAHAAIDQQHNHSASMLSQKDVDELKAVIRGAPPVVTFMDEQLIMRSSDTPGMPNVNLETEEFAAKKALCYALGGPVLMMWNSEKYARKLPAHVAAMAGWQRRWTSAGDERTAFIDNTFLLHFPYDVQQFTDPHWRRNKLVPREEHPLVRAYYERFTGKPMDAAVAQSKISTHFAFQYSWRKSKELMHVMIFHDSGESGAIIARQALSAISYVLMSQQVNFASQYKILSAPDLEIPIVAVVESDLGPTDVRGIHSLTAREIKEMVKNEVWPHTPHLAYQFIACPELTYELQKTNHGSAAHIGRFTIEDQAGREFHVLIGGVTDPVWAALAPSAILGRQIAAKSGAAERLEYYSMCRSLYLLTAIFNVLAEHRHIQGHPTDGAVAAEVFRYVRLIQELPQNHSHVSTHEYSTANARFMAVYSDRVSILHDLLSQRSREGKNNHMHDWDRLSRATLVCRKASDLMNKIVLSRVDQKQRFPDGGVAFLVPGDDTEREHCREFYAFAYAEKVSEKDEQVHDHHHPPPRYRRTIEFFEPSTASNSSSSSSSSAENRTGAVPHRYPSVPPVLPSIRDPNSVRPSEIEMYHHRVRELIQLICPRPESDRFLVLLGHKAPAVNSLFLGYQPYNAMADPVEHPVLMSVEQYKKHLLGLDIPFPFETEDAVVLAHLNYSTKGRLPGAPATDRFFDRLPVGLFDPMPSLTTMWIPMNVYRQALTEPRLKAALSRILYSPKRRVVVAPYGPGMMMHVLSTGDPAKTIPLQDLHKTIERCEGASVLDRGHFQERLFGPGGPPAYDRTARAQESMMFESMRREAEYRIVAGTANELDWAMLDKWQRAPIETTLPVSRLLAAAAPVQRPLPLPPLQQRRLTFREALGSKETNKIYSAAVAQKNKVSKKR